MEIKTLGEICEIVSGGTPARSNPAFWNNGHIPWIKIGNIKGKYVSEADEFITQEGLDGSSAKMLNKGTLLYTIFATLGETGILTIDACTNQAIAGLTIKNPDQITTDYLYYYLKSKKSHVNNIGRGVAQNNINLSILRDFKIPIPDISQQLEMVDILNKVENIISARQNEMLKLDELIKARFVEMFGDPDKDSIYPRILIKDITDVTSGGTPDRKNLSYWKNGDIPWIKTTELQNNILFSAEEYITEEGMKNSSAKIVPKDTVLIAMYGQGKTRGMTALLDFPATTNQACACILPSNLLEPKYLWQYMVLSYDRLRNLAQGGNQPNLNGNMIKNFPITVPPKNEQKIFADFVTQVDKSKAVVQKALDEAQLLFDSLMQQYFG